MLLDVHSSYDEDHEAFRDSVRKFLATEVVPVLDDWRAAGRFPDDLMASAGEQGFLGTSVHEEFGGGGVDDPRFVAVLVEEAMAIGAAGLSAVLARHCGVSTSVLLDLEPGEARSSWLTGVASGELLAVPAVLDTSLRARGVPGAAVAALFVLAVPGPEPLIAVVPRESVTVEPVSGPLGGREAAAGDVLVDQAVLASAPTKTDIDGAFARDLDLWSAVCAVAGARAALDLTLAYVSDRKVFGRPVAEFENTRFRLAELGSEIAAAAALTNTCLDALASGSLPTSVAAAARLTSGRVHDQAVDQGMQLHGGYGYMREYPIAHAFADARFLRLAAGDGSQPREAIAAALGL
jgi:acyl-CoA dehydrogenase